jgi:predicted DNA-binding WGR domain protein
MSDKTLCDQVTLSYVEGTSDKIYHAYVYQIGSLFQVECEWGRRTASKLSNQVKFAGSYSDCLTKLNKIVSSKEAKGYTEDYRTSNKSAGGKFSESVDGLVASEDERAKALERLRRAG